MTIFDDRYREYPISGSGLLLYIDATDSLERGVINAGTLSPLVDSAMRSVQALAYIDALIASASPSYAESGYTDIDYDRFESRRAFLADLAGAVNYAWRPTDRDEYRYQGWRHTPALEPVREMRGIINNDIGVRYLHFGSATSVVAALGEQVAKPGVLAELLNFLVSPRSRWRRVHAESQAAVEEVERLRLENARRRWENLDLATEVTLKVVALPVRLRDLDAAAQQAGLPPVPLIVREHLEAMHATLAELVVENTDMPPALAEALTDNARDIHALVAMGQVDARAGEVELNDPMSWTPPA